MKTRLAILLTGLGIISAGESHALTTLTSPIFIDNTNIGANNTYTLNDDITAPGTAIFIMIPNVTLDLNGHTITFGTDDRSGAVGVYPFRATSAWDIGSDDQNYPQTNCGWGCGGANGASPTIKNGSIVWGGSIGIWASDIAAGYGPDGAVVQNMHLQSGGSDGSCIYLNYTNLLLHDTYCVDTSTQTADRMQGPAAVIVSSITAFNNIIIGGNSAINTGSGSLIYNNLLRHSGFATNGYGAFLYDSVGVTIYNNIIVPSNGRGILDNATVGTIAHDNVIAVHEMPNGEFGTDLNAPCIRMRYNAYNNQFYHNTCLAIGGTNGGNTGASGIYLTDYPNFTNYLYDNTIIAMLAGTNPVDDTYFANGITLESEPDEDGSHPGLFATDQISSNTFLGNNFLFRGTGYDGGSNLQVPISSSTLGWVDATGAYSAFANAMADPKFNFTYPQDDTYVNSALLASYKAQALAQNQSLIAGESNNRQRATFYTNWYDLNANFSLVDTRPGPGVGLSSADVHQVFGYTDSTDIQIGHSLYVLAKDQNGNPLASQMIQVFDSVASSGTFYTDSSGRGQLYLMQYSLITPDNASPIYNVPHSGHYASVAGYNPAGLPLGLLNTAANPYTLTLTAVGISSSPAIVNTAGQLLNGNHVRVAGYSFGSSSGSVKIGNQATLGASSVVVNQTVRIWSDSLIQLILAQGSLATGSTAYLFVTTSSNTVSAGFPVVLGSGYTDTTPPGLNNQNPYPGQIDVSTIASITLAVQDSVPGVDITTLRLTVSGATVTPTIQGSSNSYTLTYAPNPPLAYSTTVVIGISGADLDGNALNTSYSFATIIQPAYANIVWDAATRLGNSIWQNSSVTYSERILLDPGYLENSASKVALEFQGRSDNNSYQIKGVSIAQAATDGSGNVLTGQIVANTWTQVTFDGKSTSTWSTDLTVVPALGRKVSDPIPFSIDPTKSYYVTYYIASPSVYLNIPGNYYILYYNNQDASSQLDWSAAGSVHDYHAFSRVYEVASATEPAPTVAILAPAKNATISGNTSVSGTASGSVPLSKVEVQVDNGAFNLATGTAAWTFSLDAAILSNSTHTITARATDINFIMGASSIAVTVQNALPSVGITSPGAGATVSGSIGIAGTAADAVAVASVAVSVDGGAYSLAAGTASWSLQLNTLTLTNAAHTLSALATDLAGNTSTATVTVTVDNSIASPISITKIHATSMTVVWQSNGNPAGTKYLVGRWTLGKSTTSITVSTTSANLTGLTPNTTYFLSVRKINPKGTKPPYGAPIETEGCTLPKPPAKIAKLTAEGLDTASVRWSWQPMTGQDAATSYLFYPSNGGAPIQTEAPSVTLTGLAVNSAHGGTVRAINSSGMGPLSATVTGYTLAAAPQNLFVAYVSSTFITITWDDNGNPLSTKYLVDYWAHGWSTATITTEAGASHATITGLHASTTYYISVAAENGEKIKTAAVEAPSITRRLSGQPSDRSAVYLGTALQIRTSGSGFLLRVPEGTEDDAALLRIVTPKGQAVRELVLPELAGGTEYSIAWDGNDDKGLRVADGAYAAIVALPQARKSAVLKFRKSRLKIF